MPTKIDDIISQGTATANPGVQTVSADALADVKEGTIFAEQGDLYFTKLSVLPIQRRLWPFTHGQLAPGSTQGSRHTVNLSQVRLWLLSNPTALQGPLIEAPAGCEIAHPEHGHLIFPPGIYQVTYQRMYATELRRVED